MELDILYEDELLLAVNKPAGVVVHPTYKHPAGTLLDLLRSHTGLDPQIIGRLDKDTSGVLIAARDRHGHALLQRMGFEKDYLAVVRGTVKALAGTINLPLRIDPNDRRRVIVDNNGATAETQFERLSTASGVTVLRCRLITGRRHQIRVHLAARGWPILGDRVYGEKTSGAPRQALHSWRTTFVHPRSGHVTRIAAPLPPDLEGLLRVHSLSEPPPSTSPA